MALTDRCRLFGRAEATRSLAFIDRLGEFFVSSRTAVSPSPSWLRDDYAGLKALIEEYRMDYPEDEYRLQEGYRIVADCLEKLTPERQKFAREYWETKRGSTIRRGIRRHRLEKPVVED